MSDLRLPPQNLDAERAVIGSILIDPEVVVNIMDLLIPEYFYDPKHEIIFQAIHNLYTSNKAIDILTLTSELKNQKKLKQAGGSTYLSDIVASVPTSANVKEYADIVRQAAVRRKLIANAGKFDELARKEENSLDDVLNEVEKDILALTSNSTQRDYYDAPTLLEMQMEKADQFAKNPDGLRGIPTGLKPVDAILGGMHGSDLIIVAARPSVGKSAFSLDILRHMAVEENKIVMVFSLEMPAIQVIERMLAQQSRINLWNLRMARMTDSEFRRHSEGLGKLANSKIFVDETSGLNMMQLRSKARRIKMEHGLDCIVVDYLQLMQGNGKTDNRAQEVGEMSRSLKILARELNIPVIVLSQLNRGIESRAERIPQLSDLRESGAIEQDADIVLFLSRDVDLEEINESTDAEKDIPVTLSIAKHRNGAVGRVKLRFVGGHQKFLEYDGPVQD